MDTENNFEIEKICVDLENNDLESDKCVICFESIDSSLNNDLFMCCHSKNFHYDCVKRLNKCPLCRTYFNVNSSDYIIVSEPGCDICFKYFLSGALCGGLFLWLLFLMICNPSLRVCSGLYESNYHTLNITDVNSTSL